jgi:hypothetical protein
LKESSGVQKMDILLSLDSKDFEAVMTFHGSYIHNYFEFMLAKSKEFPSHDPFQDQLEMIAEDPFSKVKDMYTLKLQRDGLMKEEFIEMNRSLIDSKDKFSCFTKKVK